MINWNNPYEGLSAKWLRGNLHTHSAPTSPCARVGLSRVLELYEESGYDFLAISDHQHCTVVDTQTKMILLPGIEWNSRVEGQEVATVNYRDHLGVYSYSSIYIEPALNHNQPEKVLAELQGPDTLFIANHPNWLIPHHYSKEELFSLHGLCDGIEIYNAVIDRHPGNADATFKWDRVLTEKGPTLGFASDDSHFERDIGRAWLMVNVEKEDDMGVFKAIKNGRFYCSSGVNINSIGREGDTIFCEADREVLIEAVGEYGLVVKQGIGLLEVARTETDSAYVRFVLYGSGKEMGWSQPFYFDEVLD